jgi:hypothetical protein
LFWRCDCNKIVTRGAKMTKIKPKKWTEVYPAGTQEGNEEIKFFKSLARNPKYEWRSVAAISKESGLSLKRVEEIISKYFNLKMVFQNPRNEDQWAYWERIPNHLPEEYISISDHDKKNRIDKFIKNQES